MNLFKLRYVPGTTVLALLLASNIATAQSDQDKSKDKKESGRDKGSRSSSGGSSGQSDSGPQSGPRQRNAGKYGDSPNAPYSRDSRSRSDDSSRSEKGDRSGPKSDKSTDSRKDSIRKGDDNTRGRDRVTDSGSGEKKGRANESKGTTSTGKKQPGSTERSGQSSERSTASTPKPTLRTKQVANGEERVTASGQVREKVEKKSDGEHTKYIAPTGRVQKEVVDKPNGSKETIQYAPGGKVQKTTVVAKDGTRETTAVQYGRGGKERATETVKVDGRGREVSKTVVVKNTTVIVRNTTIVNNRTIIRNYDRARFGFVYRPVYVVSSPVFVSWYDPYWYGPSGVWIPHPFRFTWGWDDYGWYRWHRHYWNCYEVYPTPAYWVTDWMIAGYVADRYAAAASVEDAREEARLAREDAERAREAAQRAREDAEISEARAAQSEAEARLAKAEALAAKAEAEEARAKSRGDKPNANATPIDPQTKEALRMQVEQAVAEKKEFAAQAAKGGNPVPLDISKALADPKHIYPVSSPINVISAADQSPAGTLTEGDLLKLEPGQGATLKEANENTFVTMRVMTSKGDEGEAKAGTLVSVTLKNLQDFDSEFRAKLDLGLAEADKNKDQFKNGARAER